MKERVDGTRIFDGAFPFVLDDASKSQEFDPGMKLRDYFAAKAINAIIIQHRSNVSDMVSDAYEIADAMMLRREME